MRKHKVDVRREKETEPRRKEKCMQQELQVSLPNHRLT
jgi:hypothetical protein